MRICERGQKLRGGWGDSCAGLLRNSKKSPLGEPDPLIEVAEGCTPVGVFKIPGVLHHVP